MTVVSAQPGSKTRCASCHHRRDGAVGTGLDSRKIQPYPVGVRLAPAAQEVALRELHTLVAQNGVRGRNVEEEVWDREFDEKLASSEFLRSASMLELDYAIEARFELRRRERAQICDRRIDTLLKVREALGVVRGNRRSCAQQASERAPAWLPPPPSGPEPRDCSCPWRAARRSTCLGACRWRRHALRPSSARSLGRSARARTCRRIDRKHSTTWHGALLGHAQVLVSRRARVLMKRDTSCILRTERWRKAHER
jgi:hypothetical protein